MQALVFSKPTCTWCERAVWYMEQNDIEVEKIDVSESKENLKLMKAVAGKTTTTVPQVVIDGKFVGGYTEVERFINRL